MSKLSKAHQTEYHGMSPRKRIEFLKNVVGEYAVLERISREQESHSYLDKIEALKKLLEERLAEINEQRIKLNLPVLKVIVSEYGKRPPKGCRVVVQPEVRSIEWDSLVIVWSAHKFARKPVQKLSDGVIGHLKVINKEEVLTGGKSNGWKETEKLTRKAAEKARKTGKPVIVATQKPKANRKKAGKTKTKPKAKKSSKRKKAAKKKNKGKSKGKGKS